MKVNTMSYWTHNPFEEVYWVSRMRENFTYGSYGERLETEQRMQPRQSFTRQTMFGALKSRGFNFEESKISEEHKVEKLMALLSLSFIWSILAGEYRQEQSPIALKKKTGSKNLQDQESFQAWFGVAQERIGQFKAKKEGIFRFVKAA